MSNPILVIEDDDDIYEGILDVLGDEGYTVTRATNGQDALDLLQHDASFSLIVLDYQMPKMNGLDFLKHRENSEPIRKIPVIFMTAMGRGLTHDNVQAVINKPFELEALLNAVKTHIK